MSISHDSALWASRERAICRRCGKDIFYLPDFPVLSWRHEDPDHCRGCRAASYRKGQGHDESLNRKWSATPRK